MNTYAVIDRVADGLVRIRRTNGEQVDEAVWDRIVIRKQHRCAATGEWLGPGQLAYRPMNNSLYRYERLAASAVDLRGEAQR